MSKDVTVIGAGIVGINCALSAAELGHSATVIDRDPPASGASHGNAGVISPWSCVPQSMPGTWKSVPRWLLDPEGPLFLRWQYLPRFLPWAARFLAAGQAEKLPAIADAMNQLSRPNVDLYRQHLKGTGHEDLVRDAYYLHVFRNADSINLNQLGWQLRADRGVPLEIVRGGALRELEPELSPDYTGAVVMRGQARAMDPGAVGRALAEKAQAMGVAFERKAVTEIKPRENGRWDVVTDQGVQETGMVVLAAGVWSARLLRPLGIRVPLEAERGYHVVLRNPGISVNHSIMDTEHKFVASAMNAGVRCAGTAEFAGIDAPPDYRRARVFIKLAKKLFPAIDTNDPVEWMGRRPSMPDSLPCIGPVPGYTNLIAAFGHSHYGFGMAPATGRIVGQLVNGATPNIDLAPYRIERFA